MVSAVYSIVLAVNVREHIATHAPVFVNSRGYGEADGSLAPELDEKVRAQRPLGCCALVN
jgi:hypothetical protein